MLGNIVETCKKLVNVMIFIRDLGVLNIERANKEIKVFQSVAEFGGTAEKSSVSPDFLISGNLDFDIPVIDTDKLFHLRFNPNVGLRAGAEVNSRNLSIQEKTIFRFSGS